MTVELTIEQINELIDKEADIIKFEGQGRSVGINFNGFPIQFRDNTFIKGDQVAVNSNHDQFIRIREVMISSSFLDKYSAYYIPLDEAYEFNIIQGKVPDRLQFVTEYKQLKRKCISREDYIELIDFLVSQSYRSWEFNLDAALREIEKLNSNILEEYITRETSSPKRLIVSRILEETYEVANQSKKVVQTNR